MPGIQRPSIRAAISLLSGSRAAVQLIDVNAGDLHRRLGGYPGPSHRMPVCCDAMYEQQRAGDIVLPGAPPKGKEAALTIRYALPR